MNTTHPQILDRPPPPMTLSTALKPPLSFETFLDQYPSDGHRYELRNGQIIPMLPTGPHEDISGFLATELSLAIRQHQLPYSIPRTCLIKPHTANTGYHPDVVVLNRDRLPQEPHWPTASVIQNGTTIPLVIEVVSTNWRDDYGHELVDYEALGIAEYWIVDFRALGAVRHIGKPKQPTITLCSLQDEEYQLQRFLGGDTLRSRIFPNLTLTPDTIFAAATPAHPDSPPS